MSLGSFVLVRNEAPWIAAHLLSWLPHLDEMVFLDGNSTDGTLEIIREVIKHHPQGYKVRLLTGKDPKDLQDDYVRLFNEAMRSLSTDLAFFLHPDMIPANIPPRADLDFLSRSAVAASVSMRSFAGDPGAQLYEIKGRGEAWKNIYRLRNPDLGAHYWGHYGHADEDVYFKAITGNRHIHHGPKFDRYPYIVQDSGIEILHYSDVRPLPRRVDRMIKCLLNNGCSREEAEMRSASHPRVTLKDGDGFSFEPASYPTDFIVAREKYRHLEKEPSCLAA